jgi:hypothetical protein
MKDDEKPPVCREVWDHAVEGRDVMADAALAAHVGSCVICFRTLADLRDVPRLATALRADVPAAAVSERFWDDLAVRTTAAAAAAGAKKHRGLRIAGFATIVAAAAAAWVLVAGRARVVPSAATPPAIATAVGAEEDETADEAADVADLDESALRQLLARLRAHAPADVNALAAVGDAQDAPDAMFDDEGLNDELAELDGPALLRLERSLAGAAL